MAAPVQLVGQTLGHYRILEQIGAGGMGEVYRAHDEQLDRDVALKVLTSGVLADDGARKRFRKEALSLAKLNHPNIATVFEFGGQGGIDFLVTEYIPGVTLDAKLATGALREKEVVRLGTQLAEGLEAAHQQGVIHRDLKPGNLRVTPEGRLKVLDFGLAQLMPHASPMGLTVTLTQSQEVTGTLPYMAPEQLRGGALDFRSDIYAAGAVLYEMATGRRPFEDKLSTTLIDNILHKPPSAPGQFNPALSPRLEDIILKCLEKDPDNRYQSVRELLVDLRRLSTTVAVTSTERRPTLWRRHAGKVAVVIAVLAVVIAWTLKGSRDLWRTDNLVRIESIAVLPLENLSHDPAQDYLADGMTEALITDLGEIRGLRRVISRTSVMRYKTESKPISDIARQLNVDAVVEGSVQRSGTAIQVTARLVNASTDTQLWSRSYRRELRDLLTLQRELALTIANEIKIKLTPEEHARLSTAHPVDPAAQEAYLKATYLGTGTSEQRRKAREYLEQAVRLDPNYAPAYAGLADSYWNNIDLIAQKAMPKAKGHALKALALDDTLAHAHTALASILFYGDWDWPGADKEFKRALELNPNDAEAHRMYSVYLSAMGQFDNALTQVQAAQQLDPLSIYNNTTAGWTLYCARQYDRAIEQCRTALELAPNFDGAHACLSYAYLGKRDYSQAIEQSQKAFTLSGGDAVRAVWLGRAYAEAGKKLEARKVLIHLNELSRHTYIPPYFIATLYLALGDKDQAFIWLEKAYAQRDLYLATLKVDQAVDPLRSDRRFQGLLRRLNFSP